MIIILGGLGRQGIAITHFLLEFSKQKIIITDIKNKTSIPSQHAFLLKDPRVSYSKQYWQDIDTVGEDSITVISCLAPHNNRELTRDCCLSGYNFIDLGGDTNIVKQQIAFDDLAKEKGVAVVPDCGLAPGIIASDAARYESPNLINLEVYCGGIPERPELPLGYDISFMPEGVIKEYTGIAQEIKNGQIVYVPALSGREFIHVPGLGVMEAAATSGGTSIAAENLSINNFSYKTLRYPGHWDYVSRHILTQPDPVDTLKMITKEVSRTRPDVIVLMYKMIHITHKNETIHYWRYDMDRDLSAMSQATGYIVGSVALLIEENKILSGVIGMEEIPANDIWNKVVRMPNSGYSRTL